MLHRTSAARPDTPPPERATPGGKDSGTHVAQRGPLGGALSNSEGKEKFPRPATSPNTQRPSRGEQGVRARDRPGDPQTLRARRGHTTHIQSINTPQTPQHQPAISSTLDPVKNHKTSLGHRPTEYHHDNQNPPARTSTQLPHRRTGQSTVPPRPGEKP